MQSTKPKIFRTDIQQIRAISVIAVVMFHSFPDKFAYGYLGVDVFFFLSGFLIFPQIHDITKSESKTALKFNVKKFILRRIYRIGPALGFCILVVWILFFFFGPSPKNFSGPEFYISILSMLGFGNIAALNYEGDYFSSSSPLTHFWSLGVEIQSYFLFAMLTLFLSRIINKNLKRFRIFLFMIILVSLISKYVFLHYSNIFDNFGLDTLAITGSFSDFYLTPNRLWQFALGGLFATFTTIDKEYTQLNKKTSKLLFVTVSILLLSKLDVTNNYRVIVILSTVGLYLISNADKEIKYVTSFLVWIGDRSYSIYLYHLPMLFILSSNSNVTNLTHFLFIMTILIILLISNYSYKYIELTHRVTISSPNDRQNLFTKHRKLFLTSYLVPVSGIVLVIILNNLFPVKSNFPLNFVYNYAASELSKCKLGQIEEPCTLTNGPSSRNWLLLGDSHAGAIQGAISEIALQAQANFLVWNKCRFFDPNISLEMNSLFPKWCVDSNIKRIEYIKRVKPSLIFIAYQNGSVAKGDNQMPQNLWQDVFTSTLRSINSNDSTVILFSQLPEYTTPPSSDYRYSIGMDKNLNVDQFTDLPKQRIYENKLRNENILVIDLVPTFCNSISCTRFIDNWLYLDTNHLSNFGAELIIPTIKNFIHDKQLA
jgi:peptidoglycan/LPS O-acetylase OafA/YrhL